MKTLLVTLVAIDDLDDPVADCQAEICLMTYEITDVTDDTFVHAKHGDYEDFAIEIESKYYPVAVDYMPTGNEFMLMDAKAIAALKRFVGDNPTLIYGEVDDADFDDEETEENT